MKKYRNSSGFTLIELLIASAVAILLFSIAYPSYMELIQEKRQIKGKALIMEIMQLQEEYFSQNMEYTLDLSRLGYKPASHEYADEYHVLAQNCTNQTIQSCVQLIAKPQKPGSLQLSTSSLSDIVHVQSNE